MSLRALVTGANGFVGQALTAHLRRNGWTVCGAVHGVPADCDQLPCDVRDPEQVDRLFRWAGDVTHVFHLAAVAFVPEANRDPARTFEINLNGTVRVVEALLDRAPRARLVFIGSSGVYGPPQSLPVTEDHSLNPQNVYDISKAAADQYVAYAQKARSLDAVRMRAFNHSGPGQDPEFVLPNFARQIARIEAGLDEPVLRVGNLDARRDFSHVDDVVRAYELAALHGRSGAAYNVCSGKACAVREALERLLALSRASIEVEVDPARLRPIDVPEVVGSHERLTADTGWTPKVPFDRLMEDLLQYWRKERQRQTLGSRG
jgi:GDP-4-dehydro-6-deoxy-D-mannose reductase